MSQQVFMTAMSKKNEKTVRRYILNIKTYVNKYFRYQQGRIISCVQQILLNRNFMGLGGSDENMCLFQKKKQNMLVTITPYIDHDYIHLQEDDYLQANTGHIIQQIICKIFKADPLFMYSYENIFFSPQTNSIQFNKLSVAGLIPILLKTKFHKEEFAQVYELLDESMFEQKQMENRKELITVQTKFRAIGMMILHLIFKKRISLLLQKDLPAKTDYVQFNQAFELVKRQTQKFARFLSMPQNRQQIYRAEKRDSINYLYFLQRVFTSANSKEKELKKIDWKQIFDLLIPKHKQKNQKNQKLNHYNEIINKQIKQKYVKQLQNPYKKWYLQRLGIYDYYMYLIYLTDSPNLRYNSFAEQIFQQKSSNLYNSQLFNQIIKIINYNVENRYKIPTTQNVKNIKDVLIVSNAQKDTKSKHQIQLYNYQSNFTQIQYQYTLLRQNQLNQYGKDDEKTQYEKIIQRFQLQFLINEPFIPFDEHLNDEKSQNQKQIKHKMNESLIQINNMSNLLEFKHQSKKQTRLPAYDDDQWAIINKICKNFKANTAEIKGVKIYGVEPTYAILHKYLNLSTFQYSKKIYEQKSLFHRKKIDNFS